MEKEKRKYVCPLANGEDSWEAECELILKYLCPFASMPHMRKNYLSVPIPGRQRKLNNNTLDFKGL